MDRVKAAGAAALLMAAALLPLVYAADRYSQAVIGPSAVVLSTFVMSAALQSAGAFRHAAANLIASSRGSGARLFWGLNGFCFLLTLFFSTIVSIQIATPIIVQICKLLSFDPKQRAPYLIAGALVSAAAGVPAGAASLGSLMALKLAGLSLNELAEQLFLPSLLSVLILSALLYLFYRGRLPKRIAYAAPLSGAEQTDVPAIRWRLLRICLMIVVTTRAGFFIGSGFGAPLEWIAVSGSLVLLAVLWLAALPGWGGAAAKTPWHILLFAFGAYMLAVGLQQTGVARPLAAELERAIAAGSLQAVMTAGGIYAVLAGMCNHLPAILIGTLSLKEAGADPQLFRLAFAAGTMGGGLGSLLTPFGSAAALLWMSLLKRHQAALPWAAYLKAAAAVVPLSLLAGLLSLFAWTQIIG